jgi:hypothetical protein
MMEETMSLTNAERQQRFRDRRKAMQPTVSEIANSIRKLNTRIVEDVVNIGRALAKAKEQLQHGEWLRWLGHEFAWTDRTAHRYMRLAELANSTRLSDMARLPLSGLYQLAAPSTPDEVRDTIIDRAAAGEQITAATIAATVEAKSKSSSKSKSKSKLSSKSMSESTLELTLTTTDDRESARQYAEQLKAQRDAEPWEKMTPRERCLDRIRYFIAMYVEEAHGEDRARMFADLHDLLDRIESELVAEETAS